MPEAHSRWWISAVHCSSGITTQPLMLGGAHSPDSGRMTQSVALFSTKMISFPSHQVTGRGGQVHDLRKPMYRGKHGSRSHIQVKAFSNLGWTLQRDNCRQKLSLSQILYLWQPSTSPMLGVRDLGTEHLEHVGGLIYIEVGRQGLTSTSKNISKYTKGGKFLHHCGLLPQVEVSLPDQGCLSQNLLHPGSLVN